MLDTLHSQVGVGVTLLVVGFAFLKGDEPERVGAGACALGLLASLLLQDDSRLTGPQWGLMAVDGVMLVVYAALAWRSRRSWPVWAGGLQGVIVMTHAATLVDPRPPLSAFYAVLNIASYGILVALAVGVLGAWNERRALGLS
ncbi:MAG TPA: hypothetical protein VFF48_01135 [Brevundimonas sp.]|nr:hypothetical protein [Brevundimonas sp.]